MSGANRQRAVLVDGPTGHPVSFCLLDGDGFTRDHALVDRGPSFDHLAIDRNAVAGPHAQQVTCNDVFERRVVFRAVWQDSPRCLGREVQKRPDRVPRAFPCAQLQHLTHEDQRDDDNGGLVIRADALAHPVLFREHTRRKCGEEGIDIGRADAKRDQRPHVG